MILAEPNRTPYDLNFQLLGFPVRIHPLFWLMGFILGFQGLQNRDDMGILLVIWMLVVFVSILVHELGHALMMRRFGRPAHIVLHWMGGLAIEGSDSPHSSYFSFSSSGFGRRSRSPLEQILISLAGPGAGFVLAGVTIGLVLASGGNLQIRWLLDILPMPDATLGPALVDNQHLDFLVGNLLFLNIIWGLVNLLPVFPLDGGQVAQQLFIVNDPWGGTVKALWLSVIVGAAVAVIGGVIFKDMFVALFFASLAVSNYFTLQQLGGRGRPW